MKKIIIYVALLAAALLLPIRGTDVGKLIPVEVVGIYKEDSVTISTDLGEAGVGATVGEAIANLKDTTAGIIFLDTADYLLVDETAGEEAAALKEHLKPTVRVCLWDRAADLKETAAFLNVHKPTLKLKTYDHAAITQILTTDKGRMILKDK